MFFINKITFPTGIWLLLFLVMVISACSKTDFPELKDNQIGFDPATEKEEVNRILQVRGSFQEIADFPQKSEPITLSGLTYVPARPYFIRDRMHLTPDSVLKSLDTIQLGNEIETKIPVHFTKTEFGEYFKPEKLFLKVSGTKGLWTIPFQPDQSLISGFFSLAVPRLIKDGQIKITISSELRCTFPGQTSLRVKTDTVNAVLKLGGPLKCGFQFVGGVGYYLQRVDLGEKPGKVKISFNTGPIPDRMEIIYNQKNIISTCPVLPDDFKFPSCSEEGCFTIIPDQKWRDYFFDYNPDNGKYLQIIVLGWCSDPKTGWGIRVSCPE
jgi:hypothetical protein